MALLHKPKSRLTSHPVVPYKVGEHDLSAIQK